MNHNAEDNSRLSTPESIGHSSQASPTRYSKATHLSEFYPYLNKPVFNHDNNNSTNHVGTMTSTATSEGYSSIRSRKPSLSTMNSFTSFAPSTLDFNRLLTKTDIVQTTETFNEILDSAREYRRALLTLAEAAENFGSSLEKGSKCKGSGTAADGLLSASGLFFLVANHQQILAHSVEESFAQPMAQEIALFKEKAKTNDELFRVNIRDSVKTLKQQERENAKLSKSKTRNLVAYKSKLLQLTSHIDEIDKLKHDYYQSSFDLVQSTSMEIMKKLGSIVRAQVEISEGIAKKGWSGGGLDDLIVQCADPFTPEEEDDNTIEEEEENDNTIEEEEQEQPKLEARSEETTTSLRHLGIDDNGIGIDRVGSVVEPVLTHQQSIRTLESAADSSLYSSTPIKSKLKEKFLNKSDITAGDTSMDDNSFSLPVLHGSSRVLNVDEREEEAEAEPEQEAEQETRSEDPQMAAPPSPLRNVWNTEE